MEEPIRVLHFGMTYALGGIETFVMNVYRNIDRSKIQFDFIKNGSKMYFEEEVKEMGARVHTIVPRRENPFLYWYEINNIIKQNNYKIIHCHMNSLSTIKPIIAAKKAHYPCIIVHSHNQWRGTSKVTQYLHDYNFKKLKKINTFHLACSDVASHWIFGEDSKAEIIHNGIDLEKYAFRNETRRAYKKLLDLNEEEKVVGHIGRFDYQKNHEFLIDIFYEMLQQNPKVNLLLIGDGELKDKVKQKVKALGISNKVSFLGVREDVNKFLNVIDVLLLPSHYEGLPITLIEAQANGVPCIISDVISKDVKVTESIEYMSLNKSAKTWAQAALRATQVSERKDTYKQMKLAGYDIYEVVKRLETIYIEGYRNGTN